MKTICCVLKSGGDFEPKHVEWLRRQCAEHMPQWRFQCWSDMDIPSAVSLIQNWPKWWGKFQIYATDFDGPALIVDLDTAFLGELKIRPEHEDKAIFLRDPWRDGLRYPERLGGGFTYLPQWARQKAWQAFSADPQAAMDRYDGDDQPFYHALFSTIALRWPDHYIDQVISYKAQAKQLGINKDTRIVYWHGFPRPWACSEEWIPKFNP